MSSNKFLRSSTAVRKFSLGGCVTTPKPQIFHRLGAEVFFGQLQVDVVGGVLSGRSNLLPAFDTDGLEGLVEVIISQFDWQELGELSFC